MKRKIIAVGICTALIGGFGGCDKGGEEVPPAETTAVTEASETALETSAEKEEKAETGTSETAKSTEGLTVSPSGYALDPNVTLGEKERTWEFPLNTPCLIGEPADCVRVYGVNTDTEWEFHYLNTAMGEEYFSVTSCVIIEHDGIADEFAGFWGERSGASMSVYSGDFDGDSENEIATLRYDTGGTFCRIMELVLYKLNEGHYEQFVFSPRDFNKKYLTVDIDNEERVLTLSANGFDRTFTYDFSESVPPDVECSVNMIQVNDFIFGSGEITYIITPLIGNGNGLPETPVDICLKLNFSDGVFACSDVEFIENEPYRSAEPEYAVDFDTAVSNIIAAGVEADNSEFVLSGTENSDGETYYKIVKGYDNGETVSAEEIFRVNTENGSVYVYFDPTLPMSDYLAQFKSEDDENDPQSRYIKIYGGTS